MMEELIAGVMGDYAVLCREIFMHMKRKEYDEEGARLIADKMSIISDCVHNLPRYALMEDKRLLKSEVKMGMSNRDNMFSGEQSHHLMLFVRIRKAFRELELYLSEG